MDPELGQMCALISYTSPLPSTSCHDVTDVSSLRLYSELPTETSPQSERAELKPESQGLATLQHLVLWGKEHLGGESGTPGSMTCSAIKGLCGS